MSTPRTERQMVAVPGLKRPIDVENVMAEIEKGQQFAGHFPEGEALERARRVLVGKTSIEEARHEIRQAFNQV